LRREWEEVRARANAEAEKAATQTGRKASNTLQRAERDLSAFAARLRKVSVLDPACGSGNFLYVSLKELLDLEKEVSTFAGEIGLTPFFPEVSPEQLHGLETSPYAHELAQVAIWIGYLQWLVENGFGTRQEPILGPMTNIVEMDAILSRDEDGIVHEPEWPEADVIVGNPPFLGGKRLRAELQDEYVDDLFALYRGRVPREADLVCYWFEKAREQVEQGKVERVGLLATQAIRGGANRRVLQRIKQSGDIFFAESDRRWILEGAAVQVSMVGFDNGAETERMLDEAHVDAIFSNLTGDLDLTEAKSLPENGGIAFQGPVVVGPFDVPPEIAEMLLLNPNPNGRPSSDVIFPVVNAADLTRRARRWQIVDFGLRTEEDASMYEAPFEYVKEHVMPLRDTNRDRQRREYWWRHGRAGTQLRAALSDKVRQIATPRVAKHRLFVWLPSRTIVTDAVVAFALEDDYSFGVLHSRVHEVWARRMGTQLREAESGFRYTPTTCFETFPFPEPSEEQRTEIARAARRLDDLRSNWLDPEGASEAELRKRTLTNLYNQRPTWLENTHARLDKAVFAAYGWSSDLSDEEVLQNLLALNLERSDPH
jgi:type II restriction/modification system DNA methylase subunit YeeA